MAEKVQEKEVENEDVLKDQLSILRDGELLSWAKVADKLELGSPGAARRVYTRLVRDHRESVLPSRAKASAQPVDLAGADLATIREAIAGRTIVVDRKDHQELIKVAKVTSLKNGTINLSDGAKARAVKASAVVAVR